MSLLGSEQNSSFLLLRFMTLSLCDLELVRSLMKNELERIWKAVFVV